MDICLAVESNKTLNQFLRNNNERTVNILVVVCNTSEDENENIRNKKCYIYFTFNSNEIKTECNNDTKIYDVARKFTRKIGKDINSLIFLRKGKKLDSSENFKELAEKEFVLKILVIEQYFEAYQKRPIKKESSNKKVGTEDEHIINKKCDVCFLFKGIEVKEACNYNNKIIDVASKFTSKIGKDINSLIFLCKGKKLDLSKRLKELAEKESFLKILVIEQYFGEYQKRQIKEERSNKKVKYNNDKNVSSKKSINLRDNNLMDNNIDNNMFQNNNVININKLKNNNIKNNSANKNVRLVDFDKIIVIQFITGDQSINRGIKCLPTDTFVSVEEKLYQIYPEFRQTNNDFITNGRLILKFKTIEENQIKDGQLVQLIKRDE